MPGGCKAVKSKNGENFVFSKGGVTSVTLFPFAGIAALAAQGVQPIVQNEATQNSPGIQVSGLLPRRAHIHGLAAMYVRPLFQRDCNMYLAIYFLRVP
ncbi:hypothetical protein [Lacrimispora sp. 210928-DFI.3.58]|uniref:hypothetical protein n=1 Tax=Lacrimispora sp. 210928-DFI.3.58 TaxID=2883214 RepID=UPI001D084F01|nr:hypothetical protein [Lacrimispora sp. 210928-DFI.3.58]